MTRTRFSITTDIAAPHSLVWSPMADVARWPEWTESISRVNLELEICEIVWLVATEHVDNITNLGLNIHSDRLCDVGRIKHRKSSPSPSCERDETH